MVPALLGISLITFSLMHLTKGGPFDTEKSNPVVKASLERAYGLDAPLWPAFYGPGAGTWQTAVLVLGVLAILGGIFLLRWRGRSSAVVAPEGTSVPGAQSPTQQFIGRIALISGSLFVFWWAVMLLQGPATKLSGSGFVAGQFLQFLGNLLRGDLGPSLSRPGQNVTGIILPLIGNSFILGGVAFVILIGLAIPLGTIAALKQNTWVDYVASVISLVGYSIPNFVLGIVLILITGLWLQILPIAHWGNPVDVLLPAFVLAIRPMAVLTRLTRAAMLEVLNQDYIRTAWAKGLPGRAVVIRHAFRNALLPIVTVMGDQLGDLVTGSLVIETLFNVPGIGQYFVISIGQRDYGMIMGTTLFYATLVLIINLVVDLMYGVIDPRVRLGSEART